MQVDLGKLSGQRLRAAWFDPRTGAARVIGEFPTDQQGEFTPPSSGPSSDWVLVLDDTDKAYPLPGRSQ